MSASSPQATGPLPAAAGSALQGDLNAAIGNGALVISAETREDPADRAHRHQQEAADATLRRWKDGFRFALSAALLGGVTILAVRFTLAQTATGDEKAWARTALAALASAVAGYFIGRKDTE